MKTHSLRSVLPACRRLLFPLLYAEKGRLRSAVASRVPASRWQAILFRINCEIISGWKSEARDNAKRDLESLLEQVFLLFSLARRLLALHSACSILNFD